MRQAAGWRELIERTTESGCSDLISGLGGSGYGIAPTLALSGISRHSSFSERLSISVISNRNYSGKRTPRGASTMKHLFVLSSTLPAAACRGRMHHAAFRCVDADHLIAEWQFYENGHLKQAEKARYTSVQVASR